MVVAKTINIVTIIMVAIIKRISFINFKGISFYFTMGKNSLASNMLELKQFIQILNPIANLIIIVTYYCSIKSLILLFLNFSHKYNR